MMATQFPTGALCSAVHQQVMKDTCKTPFRISHLLQRDGCHRPDWAGLSGELVKWDHFPILLANSIPIS